MLIYINNYRRKTMLKSCAIISIQNNFQVFGLRLKARGNEKYYIDNQFTGTYTENDGPGEVLQHAMSMLNAQNCNRIIITGQIEQSGIFEIRMPNLNHDELRNAVEYELAKYIPLPLSDIVWSSRIIPDENENKDDDSEDSNEHFSKLRIIFMLRDNWTKFISELQIRQINADIYINPFMSIDPFASGQDVVLPMIDDKHVFSNNANGLRKMAFANNMEQDEELKSKIFDCFVWNEKAAGQENLEEYFACMLVGKYVMSGEYDQYEKKLALKLPKNLIPQRNKLLKWCALVNAIAVLVCLLMFLYQKREKVYCVYVEQRNAINLIQTQNRNLQKENSISKKRGKLYKKIQGAVPVKLNPLQILAFLSQKLPKTIWIRSYNMAAGKIHLSLTSSKDPGNLMSSLRNASLYNIDNIRKSRRYDGTYYLYLMLTLPESEVTSK
jgi:hypothetical protein